jgi:3-oxoacyl-[acyl-carrier-protein] synthase III
MDSRSIPEQALTCQRALCVGELTLGMRVSAVAMAVPSQTQSADELAPLIDRTAQWIHEHTGVINRRVAPANMAPAELAALAAGEVISQTGKPDLILYAGALTQQLVPDTSVFVQKALGLEGINAFTVNQTCLSFIAAIQVANSLLKDQSYSRILICAAELATRGRSFHEPESASLLGDGAAAAMIEYMPESTSELLHCKMETWPEGTELCYVRAGNHPPPSASADHEELFRFHMHGPQLYRFVRPRLKRFIADFLQSANCSIDEVQVIVPHQASGPGLRILEQCGFANERIVNIVANYGNCVAASIPMALAAAHQEQRLVRGEKVLLIGTAAGVSIGAALLRW